MEHEPKKTSDVYVAGLSEILMSAPEWSVSSLARRVGTSRYKAERLLGSLERNGLVEWMPRTGRFAVVGGHPLLLAEAKGDGARGEAPPLTWVPAHQEATCRALLQDARPVLETLARRHNETVYLTILKGNEVLFLDMVDGHCPVKTEALVGRRFPFFTNAAGKVLRAIDSWDLLEKICNRRHRGLAREAELARLRAELEMIREKGVAVDQGGMGEGIITVAVAVKDYAGKVIAAVTMMGPSFRILGERLENEIIPSLLASGESLSMKFGYARP